MNTPKSLRHLGPVANIDHIEMADIISLFAAKCTSADWCELQELHVLNDLKPIIEQFHTWAMYDDLKEIPVERCGSCHRPIKPDEITCQSPMWGTLCELCLDKD